MPKLIRSATNKPLTYTLTGPAGSLTYDAFHAELTAQPTGQPARTLGAVYGYDCRDALADDGIEGLWKAMEVYYGRAIAVASEAAGS